MPTPTYIALATITLTQNDSTIQFASIPNTYRDLVLVGRYQLSNAGVLTHAFNGNSQGIDRLRAGALATLNVYTDYGSDDNIGEWNNGDDWASVIINLMDYSATDKHKTGLMRNDGVVRNWMYVFRWNSTSAITSYALSTNQSFISGSRFTLYGIVS
jgi:hypothetical protein